MKYKKDEYHKIISLFSKQGWLIKKEEELKELITFYDKQEAKELIFSLLERFHYLENYYLQYLLNEIATYIISVSGFDIDKTQILSITYDDEADSSQRVLDMLKIPLFQKGWRGVKTVNHYSSCVKNFKKGKSQILIVDEFVGSGKTLRVRIKQLKNDIKNGFELKCCFIAGIKSAIESLQDEGVDIFCPLQLEKGISDFYIDESLIKAKKEMLNIESKLATKINENILVDYSFGYGRAEALYSMEGCNGNTPNSVFPIFWWLKDYKNNDRRTLLTRCEIGF